MTLEVDRGTVEALQGLWRSLIPGSCPTFHQFSFWLLKAEGDPEVVAWAIQQLAGKLFKKQMNDVYRACFVGALVRDRSLRCDTSKPFNAVEHYARETAQ
jgi:hypothetical protein